MRTSMPREGALSGLALAAFLALWPAAAQASVVSATDKLSSCLYPTRSGATGVALNCADTGFFNTTLAGASSDFIGAPKVSGSIATFTTAFDAWDEANGDKWTFKNGGTLNLTIRVNIGLSAGIGGAGLSPVLFTLSGASQQTLQNLVWTQALFINYSPLAGPLAGSEQTLDTFSLSQNGSNPNFPKSCSPASSGVPAAGAFCGPIYPFQYASEYKNSTLDGVTLGVDPFYDAPEGDWPDASFDAITLLSKVSVVNGKHTLTVYQGVSYGFTLSAADLLSGPSYISGVAASSIPEPPVWALMIVSLPALLVIRRQTGSSTTEKRRSLAV